MNKTGWAENVTVYDILESVPRFFKDYRITVIFLHETDNSKRTIQGPEYLFERRQSGILTSNCYHKTIYLIYDPENKHYGGCRSPRQALKLHHPSKRFCHKCVSLFSQYSSCECIDQDFRILQIKKPKKCRFCNRSSCKGNGCFRLCQFCGSKFKTGYGESEGHRCIIYDDSTVKIFNTDNLEPMKKNPDYKLWVYDLESAVERSTTETTSHFENENGEFIFDGGVVKTSVVRASKHKVNMVVYRNVFDDESETILFGPDSIHKFMEFMLSTNYGRNIAIAHNGAGYDSRLIFEEALKYKERLNISTICRGSKFMELKIGKLIFRDSLLFLPQSLSALAKSFNLPLKKGIFPHMFNSVENYEYEGTLPSIDYFDLRFTAKTEKDVTDFKSWYLQRSSTPWNFKKELTEYCRDDVKILGMIVKQFHDICVKKFSHSPWMFTTAPSYVHNLVIKGISESIALPDDEETRAETVRNLATYSHWAVLKPSEYWFARKALRGGRTDVRKLRHVLTDEERQRGVKIKYVDVVSMYPAVQVKYPYPVGTPTILVYDPLFYPCRKHQNPSKGNSVDLKCHCIMTDRTTYADTQLNVYFSKDQPENDVLNNMFGFICVTIQPPKHLYHPILVTWDEKKNKCIATLETIVEQVFTTVEVQLALENGYKIIKVHRIDTYSKTSGLWNDIIKDIYVEKLANSGPPPDDIEDIIQEYEERFEMGDKIREAVPRFKNDPAMRSVYKTLLNCGWGKHCQRPNMPHTDIFNGEEEMNSLFTNVQQGNVVIDNIATMGNGYSLVRSKDTNQVNNNFHSTYIAAGCYVPAYGRLTLIKEMLKLGDRVLYHDTDSIIYLYDPEQQNIETSDIWGEWGEEKISLKGIDSFVSIGPKSYGIRAGATDIVKLKGMSIKHIHRNMVNYDLLDSFITSHLNNTYSITKVPQMNFVYKPGNGILTKYAFKHLCFKPENLKGKLKKDLRVFPQGYCDCLANCNE